MSLYAEVRFKGIVKKEFRNYIEQCVAVLNWQESDDLVFTAFRENRFSDNVFHNTDSCVSRWNEHPLEPSFDKETGEWTFHLQYNIRWDGFDLFDDLLDILIPYCIETILFCQTWVEDEDYRQNSSIYDLVDDRLKRIGFVDEEGTCHFLRRRKDE